MDNKNRMNDRKTDILPNFLVIGAFKSGTNSLYHYLEAHPQVFMCPANEPSFFAFEGKKMSGGRWAEGVVTNFEDYKRLFAGARDEIAIGEVSPTYLVSLEAPGRIKHYLPGVKLIAILRHPVDRAYSQWQMEYRQGNEKITDFTEAIKVTKVLSDGTSRRRFVAGSLYYQLLKKYYAMFDPSQICVLLFDRLSTDREGLVRKLYGFLNVDSLFVPSNLDVRFNEGGGLPRSKAGRFFLQKIFPALSGLKFLAPKGLRERFVAQTRRQLLAKPPELAPELRAELSVFFKDDILLLQDLINEDLSMWLN
ncbi:MAG: sulfotransferase [Anaerolineales bacterium]|nr:sulfotransferase [Anaerolineales bacterium]